MKVKILNILNLLFTPFSVLYRLLEHLDFLLFYSGSLLLERLNLMIFIVFLLVIL